jgi:hypothetical protein
MISSDSTVPDERMRRQRNGMTGALRGKPTIAWHPRKDDVHIHDELLSS